MRVADELRRARFRSRLLRAPLVRYRHRGLGPLDAMLGSYPRSGTTWLRFLLSEALTGRAEEFGPQGQIVPYVGDHRTASGILPGGGRLVFTHETVRVGERRVIYVVRDPRSVALSEHRWLLRRGLAPPTFERFLDEFIAGRSNPWGGWNRHVERWLGGEVVQTDLVHLVRFEALRRDPETELDATLRSLGAELDRGSLAAVVANNTLERMQEKEREAPDHAFEKGVRREVRFVQEGSTIGWREQLTPEQRQAIEVAFGPAMQRLGYEPAPAG
jgi:hypothetical protein